MRVVTAALAAILLAGCAPEYNWREVRSAEQGYLVMLPGKPASMTRRILLGESEVHADWSALDLPGGASAGRWRPALAQAGGQPSVW